MFDPNKDSQNNPNNNILDEFDKYFSNYIPNRIPPWINFTIYLNI